MYNCFEKQQRESAVWKELDLYPANKQLHNYNLPPYLQINLQKV